MIVACFLLFSTYFNKGQHKGSLNLTSFSCDGFVAFDSLHLQPEKVTNTRIVILAFATIWVRFA